VHDHGVILHCLLRVVAFERFRQPREEKVDANTSHLELHYGSVRIRDGNALGDVLMCTEAFNKGAEELFATHMRRADAQRVDVTAWMDHT
jgi:hypothetical protein